MCIDTPPSYFVLKEIDSYSAYLSEMVRKANKNNFWIK